MLMPSVSREYHHGKSWKPDAIGDELTGLHERPPDTVLKSAFNSDPDVLYVLAREANMSFVTWISGFNEQQHHQDAAMGALRD